MRARAPLLPTALAASLAVAFVVGCARKGSQSTPSKALAPPPLAASAPSGPGERGRAAASDSAEASLPPLEAGPLRESVRARRWKDAAQKLDALPEAERARADMRFLRARVASELRDPRGVLDGLEGLDLGLLEAKIAQLRAEAWAEVGPFEKAGAYFSQKPGARAQLRAARAFERAGRLDDARKAADRGVGAARGVAGEAQARAVRMRLSEAQSAADLARADARFIALRAPDLPEAEAAYALLARLDPGWKPSPAERLARIERLSGAGKADACLAELDTLGREPGGLGEGELLHARGHALYRLRRYKEAAEVLARAAKKSRSQETDDAFHAARALSRANEDEQAVRAYRDFARDHAKDPLAEEASFLASRLLYLLGKSEEAVSSYGAYLRRYPKGKHRSAALYEQALAEMTLKQYGRARATLGTLARGEDNRFEAARLRELEGVAALGAGDEPGAQAAFAEVIRAQPLSWPAQVARARLEQMKAPLPPPIEPGEASFQVPLEVKLPVRAEFLHRLGLDDDAEEALRAEERDLALAAGPRSPEALCEGYGRLAPAARRYRIAQDQVKAEVLLKQPTPATRWAWQCLYPAPYPEPVRAAEVREGLPEGLVHAVMRQESSFDPDVVSPALAVGLMQLLPTTARTVAQRAETPFEDGSLTEPGVNIDLGARYLALLSRMWKGSLPLTIASYNAGPAAVSRWLEHAGSTEIDLWVARIPYAETRTYVARVMGNYARYAMLSGGLEAVPPVSLAVDTSLRAPEGAFLSLSG